MPLVTVADALAQDPRRRRAAWQPRTVPLDTTRTGRILAEPLKAPARAAALPGLAPWTAMRCAPADRRRSCRRTPQCDRRSAGRPRLRRARMARARRCASSPARRCRRARTRSSSRKTPRPATPERFRHRARSAQPRAASSALPGWTSGRARRCCRVSPVLGAREIGLAAAMNHDRLCRWCRRPSVAILATGDELCRAGQHARATTRSSRQTTLALAAMIATLRRRTAWTCGIVPDRIRRRSATPLQPRQPAADIMITIGGASVGEHDLVQDAMLAARA